MLMLAFLFAGFDDEFRSAYAKADRRRFVGNVFRRGFGDFSGDHRQRAAFERCIDGTGMGRAVEGKAIDHQRRIGSGRKQGVVTQGDADGTVGCGRPGRAPERFLPLDITSLLLHVIFDARFLLRQ